MKVRSVGVRRVWDSETPSLLSYTLRYVSFADVQDVDLRSGERKKELKKKKAGNRKGEMVAYPSYTLTIADGVSPVAIGRPKRYQLCLHCVLSRRRPVLCRTILALFSRAYLFPSRVSTQCGSIERARGSSSCLSSCAG